MRCDYIGKVNPYFGSKLKPALTCYLTQSRYAWQNVTVRMSAWRQCHHMVSIRHREVVQNNKHHKEIVHSIIIIHFYIPEKQRDTFLKCNRNLLKHYAMQWIEINSTELEEVCISWNCCRFEFFYIYLTGRNLFRGLTGYWPLLTISWVSQLRTASANSLSWVA